eukprot:365688-Chlamydomonas_euryale.AAC.23
MVRAGGQVCKGGENCDAVKRGLRGGLGLGFGGASARGMRGEGQPRGGMWHVGMRHAEHAAVWVWTATLHGVVYGWISGAWCGVRLDIRRMVWCTAGY